MKDNCLRTVKLELIRPAPGQTALSIESAEHYWQITPRSWKVKRYDSAAVFLEASFLPASVIAENSADGIHANVTTDLQPDESSQ